MNVVDTSLDKLKTILKREIGLDASTVGEATIKKIVNQRMRSCNIDNIKDYYKLLQFNKDELGSLLETAVIPETWFFRDSKPFPVILDRIKKQRLSTPKDRFRILSIPCSTGEEPYSLTMYLLEQGIPPACFDMHGVDISKNSLKLAEQACYGENSFRNRTEQHYIDKYFIKQDNSYIIKNSVKEKVSFSQTNILDEHQLVFNNYFDVVLCRNLLIYFDANTKDLAFNNLHKILNQNGILFIGHSEFGAVPGILFTTSNQKNAYGLIKTDSSCIKQATHDSIKKPAKPVTKSVKKVKPPKIKPFTDHIPMQPEGNKATDNSPQIETITDDNLLQQAKTLADSGSFSEAEQLCRQHIEKHGDNHECFFLLGLINEATNNNNLAEKLFRKALYLEPKHYDSLIHLALMVERSGDCNAAQLLRKRAERVATEQ